MLTIIAHPQAKQRRIVRVDDVTFEVWTTKTPVDNAANEDVLVLLAKELGIAKSRLRIVRGGSGRRKVIAVD